MDKISLKDRIRKEMLWDKYNYMKWKMWVQIRKELPQFHNEAGYDKFSKVYDRLYNESKKTKGVEAKRGER